MIVARENGVVNYAEKENPGSRPGRCWREFATNRMPEGKLVFAAVPIGQPKSLWPRYRFAVKA